MWKFVPELCFPDLALMSSSFAGLKMLNMLLGITDDSGLPLAKPQAPQGISPQTAKKFYKNKTKRDPCSLQ